jgi:hypothetical protein
MNTPRISPFLRLAAWVVAFYSLVNGLHAKEVLLRNKDGKSFTARLVHISGDKLTVVRESDKKQFVLKVAQLDESSQARVTEWEQSGGNLSEKYEIGVSTSKSNKLDQDEQYDDRVISLEPRIVIKNPDLSLATKNANVTVLFLGRPVNHRGGFYVFSNESFELPKLESGKEFAHQMKKFRHSYDDRGYSKYGARYLGWVLFLQDEKDKRIIFAKSVPGSLTEKFSTQFQSLRENTYYDDKLNILKNGYRYSN